MSTPLTQYARAKREELRQEARNATMSGDDRGAAQALFQGAQIVAMARHPHTLWVVGEQMGCDPQHTPTDDTFGKIGDEWTKGADEGPPEQLSSAARFRAAHPLLFGVGT